MCGRFTLHHSTEDVAAALAVEQTLLDLRPRFNIAPTQPVACVIQHDHRVLRALRWGLVPSWARTPSSHRPMINARAETLMRKPAFREAFRRRRCLIPASGYYEWQRLPHRRRRLPVYFHRADGTPLAFAGLFEDWQAPDGNLLHSCTIVTTEANALIAGIHDRMPAILSAAAARVWLDWETEDPARLQSLLRPCPDDDLRLHPVADLVNHVDVDTPACIADVGADPGPGPLQLEL